MRKVTPVVLANSILAALNQRSVRVLLNNRAPSKPVLGIEDGQRFVIDKAARTKNARVDIEMCSDDGIWLEYAVA